MYIKDTAEKATAKVDASIPARAYFICESFDTTVLFMLDLVGIEQISFVQEYARLVAISEWL